MFVNTRDDAGILSEFGNRLVLIQCDLIMYTMAARVVVVGMRKKLVMNESDRMYGSFVQYHTLA